jgi:hypothetical protein
MPDQDIIVVATSKSTITPGIDGRKKAGAQVAGVATGSCAASLQRGRCY